MKGFLGFIAFAVSVLGGVAFYDHHSSVSELEKMGFHNIHGHGNVYSMSYGSCDVTLRMTATGDHEFDWAYKPSPNKLLIINSAEDLRSQPGFGNCS